jgi:hypothetical protein
MDRPDFTAKIAELASPATEGTEARRGGERRDRRIALAGWAGMVAEWVGRGFTKLNSFGVF